MNRKAATNFSHLLSVCFLLGLAIPLAACGQAEVSPSPILPTEPPPSATPPPTATHVPSPTLPPPTATFTPMPTLETPDATQTALNYPLSQPGPYFIGKRTYAFKDAQRNHRPIAITLWYPALKPEGYLGTVAKNAAPDMQAAPYPLLIMSTKVANQIGTTLVPYGFVIASAEVVQTGDRWDLWMVDNPLDLLFTLEQAAAGLEGLEGVIDAENSGSLGYSFDGYNALALSGARIDPEYYLAKCSQANTLSPAPPEWWIHYICDLSEKWDEFVAHAGAGLTESPEGLWQPMTDPRIKAVMPMGPEGAWLFGERGLAVVERPILILAAGADEYNFIDQEAIPIFQRLGSPDKAMITFAGQSHMMIFDTEYLKRMAHFIVAFFGYHLQGKADYAAYFSQAFVAARPELIWGVP